MVGEPTLIVIFARAGNRREISCCRQPAQGFEAGQK